MLRPRSFIRGRLPRKVYSSVQEILGPLLLRHRRLLMPHHFARKFQTLSIVALFALIVTTLATLASWAQVTNVRRASSESSALSEPAVINAALAQPHPLPPEPATLS